MSVRSAVGVVAVAALLASPARAQELQRFEFKQIVMAIEARIVLYAPDEATAKAAASAAFAELDRLDAELSDYREDSELMRLNAEGTSKRAGLDVSLQTCLGEILHLSDSMNLLTGGRFDVAVGRSVRLWREARRTGRLPDPRALDAARLPVAPSRSLIAGDDAQVPAGSTLDLGGIAKGYALGRALECCEDLGVPSTLIEMGGDIVMAAPPPSAEGWDVDVPGGGADGSSLHLSLAQSAVSTSGDASQFVVIDGVRYSHIVDPFTGWALTNGRQATVTVAKPDRGTLAETGARCDAFATAACIWGAPTAQLIAVMLSAVTTGAIQVRISDPAFHSLFDGKSLSGWTPRGGHYDGDAVWAVADGCITGHTGADNAGGLLYTAEPHTSFEFQCECKLDYPFDSGIFVRMAPEGRGMQLTLDDRPDGEVGGLYSDGWIEHARPAAAMAWHRGEWNHVFVRCTGFDMRLEAWINGVLVMDRVIPQEFAADGKPLYAPRGLIGLQVHGGGSEGTGNSVRFRNLELRELPVFGELWATDRVLSPPEQSFRNTDRFQDGWHDLLAGAEPLDAWEAIDGEGDPHAPTDYTVKDGVLSIPSTQPAGYLRTKADYRDFDLCFQFRQARMSNSGLFLRGRRESVGTDGAHVSGGNPAYSGCEIQLLDDWNWEQDTHPTLNDWQFTGSLYGAVPPYRKGLLAPIGEWNTLEVLARGTRLACALNGQTLWDVDTAHVVADPPFAQRAAAGFLGLQRYAAPDVQGAEALGVRDMWVNGR